MQKSDRSDAHQLTQPYWRLLMRGVPDSEWICLLGSLVLCGCSLSTRVAQTASERDAELAPASAGAISAPVRDDAVQAAPAPRVTPPVADSGTRQQPREPPSSQPLACPDSLEERLTVTTIDSGTDIRYKRLGYDGFPLDESVLISVSQGGRVLLAVRENSGNRIRVVHLNSQLMREGPDVAVYAYDLGGLVAHDDGSFALLTRRDDPGEPLLDTTTPDSVGKAAMLIRIAGTRELFAQPLTGTASITRMDDPAARDCAPQLNGRLAWNGNKYGAYFAVHGCKGDRHEPYYGDKLVYVDGQGNALPGGWGWNCSISQGMRLVPERETFTSLCISDGLPFAGLNLVTQGVSARQLAPERVATGYAAGRFGSVVRTSAGRYVIAWLSRGVPEEQEQAARPDRASKPAPDIALLQLEPDYSTRSARVWLTETPMVAETNLHIAAYGPRHLLVVWDNVEAISCSEWTCWGTYTGTSARLMDLDGSFVTPDVRIAAPPNSEQDIVVLPNGDLAWAFVPDDGRDYTKPLPNENGIPSVPAKRRVSIARLSYCE